MNAETRNMILTCEKCGQRAELVRVGREKEFYALNAAHGWEVYPRCLCRECVALLNRLEQP